MTHFAVIDASGAPLGFYPDGLFKPPLATGATKAAAAAWAEDPRPAAPAEAVKISDDDYARWMADQRLRWRKDSLALPAPDLGLTRQQALARVIAFADGITARITGRYPAAEVASWPTQEAEARAVRGGAGAADAPLLDALAKAGGSSLSDMAAAVLAKAAAYRAVVAAVQAIRTQTEAAIAVAKTPDEVSAALEAARLAALAKAADLGIAP